MTEIIHVNDIKLYAFHGCLPEESIIGGNYIVDVTIYGNFSSAAKSDELSQTVDYCNVFEIVKREMAIRSKLIEHAADRIATSLKKEISKIEKVEVKLTKLSPPVNGPVGSVSVIVSA